MRRLVGIRILAGVLGALALVPLLLLAGACGETAVTDSGVQGEVRIGPINPVEQPGQQNDGPYAATLRIKRASNGKLVAETRSSADGSFRAVLPPGDYILEPVNGDPLPTAQSQDFTVAPGRFTTIRVDYDSGIR